MGQPNTSLARRAGARPRPGRSPQRGAGANVPWHLQRYQAVTHSDPLSNNATASLAVRPPECDLYSPRPGEGQGERSLNRSVYRGRGPSAGGSSPTERRQRYLEERAHRAGTGSRRFHCYRCVPSGVQSMMMG